jgi:hypothetical protein
VVLLPLVCASGVLSGLHPLPFLLSVSGLGVPLVGASGLGVWSVWSVWCGYILHQSQRSYICTRFQIVTKEKTKKAKETGKQFIIEFYGFKIDFP